MRPSKGPQLDGPTAKKSAATLTVAFEASRAAALQEGQGLSEPGLLSHAIRRQRRDLRILDVWSATTRRATVDVNGLAVQKMAGGREGAA